MARKLTVADRLLIAASHLAGDGGMSFTAEELVVKAWSEFRETFGLRGILDDNGLPMYPDSNRVFAEIMGSKPLRKNGLLEKVGDKQYRLTAAGLQRARVLASADAEQAPRRSLGRNLQNDLRRLVRSRVVSKYRDGRQKDVTFMDACGFWGISPRSSAMDLEAKLAHVEAVLGEIRAYGGDKSVVVGRLPDVTSADVDRLFQVHEDLQHRFSDELDLIRRRTDER